MPWLPIDLLNGSSFSATRASPAESSKLEIVPSAIRLIVFIAQRLRSAGRARRFLKSPILTPIVTFFPVVKQCAAWINKPYCQSPTKLKSLRIHKLACLFLLAALAFPREGRGEEGRPIVTSFSARDMGSGGECWVTVQDRTGMLYFGCDEVLGFDGERWTRYPVPGSYAVRALALSPIGRLWVGAVNEIGYFEKTEKGLSPYHSLVANLPQNARELGDVWQVLDYGKGAVFVTATSLLVWNGNNFHVYSMPGARRLVAMQVNGGLFVSHSPTGLWSLEADGLHEFISPEALNRTAVSWIEKDTKGWLLATTDGLYRFDEGRIYEVAPQATDYIRKNVLTSVCRSSHGELCVGTLYGGLAILSPSGAVERILTVDNGLPARGVFSLFFSEEGTLWITSGVGIARIALNSGVTLFDAKQGLTGKPCTSVSQGGSQILVATQEGIFSLPIGESGPARFHAVTRLSGHYTDLESGPGETAYASGFKRVVRIDGDEVSEIFSSKTDIQLLHLSSKAPNEFLLANGFDIVRLNTSVGKENASVTLAHLPDLPLTLTEDSDGNVWVGTASRGAFIIRQPADRPSELVRLKSADGLADTGRVGVASVNDIIAVFTTKGAQIYASPLGPPELLTAAPKTIATAISNRDKSGAVWVAFESPFADGPRIPVIGRLSAAASDSASWVSYAVPGLTQIGEIRSIFVDSRGILWMGGVDGMLRLDPNALRMVEAPHAPLIHASVNQGERLSAEKNSVTFDFSAVEYVRREAVRFQTKLSGGSEWSAPSNNTHLVLAGLRDSSY